MDAELDHHIARARLNLQKVIPYDPDIHPDRIRFGEVTKIPENVNIRKACGPDRITNKITRYLIPTLHIILQDLLNICVCHGYHPRAWKRAWVTDGLQTIQKEIRPMLLQAHFPSLLPKQSVRSHHDQAVNFFIFLFFYLATFLRQQWTRKFTNTDINFPDSQPPRRNDIVGLRIPY